MKSNTKMLAMALVCALFIGQNAQAQMTSYEVSYDNPETYKRLIVNFQLVDMELAQPASFRFGLGAEFNLNKKLLFTAEYGYGLVPKYHSEAIIGNQTSIEAGGVFSFASSTKSSKSRLIFNYDNEKYKMKVETKVMKQYGIRGGISSFTAPKDHDAYISLSSANSIYAGLTVMRTRNYLVTISDHGTHSRNSRGKLYADVLFAPVITLSDNTNYSAYDGSAFEGSAATFPDLAKNHLGFRIGYTKRVNRPIPLNQGIEAGIRPGVGKGYYVAFKVAISLGFIDGKEPKAE